MTQALPLDGRVAILEDRMDDVEDLAGRTGREVGEWRATLNNHTETLNAIRDDHVEQGKRLTQIEKTMRDIEKNVRDLEKKMRDGFGKLAGGQKLITQLLSKHLGKPDDETPAGGAGE